MAEVFKAKTFSVGGFESLFVIKRILAHLGEDPEFVAMFVDEAKVSVALQHPNIVRVFDVGKEGPHFFIAMEHVEGRDLRKLLAAAARAREPLPIEHAVWVISEASKGLHFAHTRTESDGKPLGIVHRDVSPSNLLLTLDGDCKIADFGIAKAESNDAITDSGVLKGKYEYMSPEQTLGGPIDARSDIFALGIILYELLTGRRAFKGESDAETLDRVRAAEVPAPREVEPSISEALEVVVLKALARDPDDRYQSARDLGEALRKSVEQDEDALKRGFSTWVNQLIGDELAVERARLEVGSKVAAELHQAVSLAEENTPLPTTDPRQGRLVGTLAVALLAMLALLLGVLYVSTQETSVPEITVAVTGSLDFDVTPEASIYVSGRLVGEGERMHVPELAPGDYEIRLEAEGHIALEETVRVTRGGATRIRRELEAGLGDAAPVVKLSSRPSGARVRIDGKEIGKTPLDWADGKPGTSYRVQMDLDGYQPWSSRIEGLALRDQVKLSGSLKRKPTAVATNQPSATPRPAATPAKPPASGKGKLRVVLTGATWAHVYVDDAKLDRTAPFSGLALSAGAHTIRVENPAVGLTHTQRVTVAAGETSTVRALVR